MLLLNIDGSVDANIPQKIKSRSRRRLMKNVDVFFNKRKSLRTESRRLLAHHMNRGAVYLIFFFLSLFSNLDSDR